MSEPNPVLRSISLQVWRLSFQLPQGARASFLDRLSSFPRMDKRDHGPIQESTRPRYLGSIGRA